jgi:hypothetical protein
LQQAAASAPLEPLFDSLWAQHSALPGGRATLEQVRAIETLGALGGAKYVYVYSKLLAAAAWKLHVQPDPLSPKAGAAIRQALLCRGARVSPQQLVAGLLGPEALAQVAGGWVPDLAADCYQDVDLLG